MGKLALREDNEIDEGAWYGSVKQWCQLWDWDRELGVNLWVEYADGVEEGPYMLEALKMEEFE